MAERHEHGLYAELRAVDAALLPLKPSRELDERIDALLAGRAPRRTHRRVALAGLGVCAAAAAFALFFGSGEPAPIAAAPAVPAAVPAPLAPTEPAATPEAAPTPRPAPSVSGAGAAAPGTSLALADRAEPVSAPALSEVEARAVAVALPAPAPPAEGALPARRVVKRGTTADASLVARPAADDTLGPDARSDAELEAALSALRADKARGDLRGAVARIDGLLQSRPGARVVTVLRLERARLQERLGDPAAACAGLADLPGDDAHDARARLACP